MIWLTQLYYLRILLYIISPNLPNFLNGIINLQFLGLSIIIFRDSRMRTWSSCIQQYRAWSNCMDVQACLYILYWWQRLLTFCSGRIRIKSDINLLPHEVCHYSRPWIMQEFAAKLKVIIFFKVCKNIVSKVKEV